MTTVITAIAAFFKAVWVKGVIAASVLFEGINTPAGTGQRTPGMGSGTFSEGIPTKTLVGNSAGASVPTQGATLQNGVLAGLTISTAFSPTKNGIQIDAVCPAGQTFTLPDYVGLGLPVGTSYYAKNESAFPQNVVVAVVGQKIDNVANLVVSIQSGASKQFMLNTGTGWMVVSEAKQVETLASRAVSSTAAIGSGSAAAVGSYFTGPAVSTTFPAGTFGANQKVSLVIDAVPHTLVGTPEAVFVGLTSRYQTLTAASNGSLVVNGLTPIFAMIGTVVTTVAVQIDISVSPIAM